MKYAVMQSIPRDGQTLKKQRSIILVFVRLFTMQVMFRQLVV